MSNNKNKTHFICILLDQWSTDKCVTRLVKVETYPKLLMKRCSVLPVKTTRLSPNILEEEDTCTMFILYCLNIRTSLPDASTTIVTSK